MRDPPEALWRVLAKGHLGDVGSEVGGTHRERPMVLLALSGLYLIPLLLLINSSIQKWFCIFYNLNFPWYID